MSQTVWKGKPATHWNFPVTKELDAQVFEVAHQQRMTKAEFVRAAVEEKIKRLSK